MTLNRRRSRLAVIAVLLGFLFLAVPRKPSADADQSIRLPTGRLLEPAGRSFDVGNMPLAMALSPQGGHFVVSLNGWREQGVQVIERASGRVTQTLLQPAAFLGLVFSPDGRMLYVSGGNEDAVYRYGWIDGSAKLVDRIALAEKSTAALGTRYPAGLAISADGRHLYVAENIANSLAVIDLEGNRILQRLEAGRYPYQVSVARDGKVYVSAWGGDSVSVFRRRPDGRLASEGRIVVGRHPSAIMLNSEGSRLFVACASADRIVVVDTGKRRVIAQLLDSPPAGPRQGSTPNGLALSADGRRLFVAEADNNAVALFDLSSSTAGTRTENKADRLAGRIPAGWYPTALLVSDDSLWVLNGKGRASTANPDGRQPNQEFDPASTSYVLGQLNGTMSKLPLSMSSEQMRRLTERVSELNGWNNAPTNPRYPAFKHVVYVIKENRTYDQIFGDMPGGDGDPELLFFSKRSTPNHRALAERFGLFDRFFVNAEVSQQGHQWSTAAYVTDYTEKTTPLIYSNRRAGPEPDDDEDNPVNGYLWDAALRNRISLRNYGEFVFSPAKSAAGDVPRYRPIKAALIPVTNPDYPGYDLNITDQTRADVWVKEFQEYVGKGTMPALEIIWLPGDHTAGARPGQRTPAAYVADNDLALGRIVSEISRSKFWKDTVIFVLEDDAQDGPDHVDSHRSVLLVISPYNRAGTHHRFVNTTDVIATIEEILGIEPLSQFDYYGLPLREIFSAEPDLRPYQVLTPQQSLLEMNQPQGRNAEASLRLDLSKEDIADMDQFNRILWRTIKGDAVPYPSRKRASSLEYIRGH